MEIGWVWTLMGAHSELWPPRCFSQHPSLVHRSPGPLFSFPGEPARSLPSVGTRSYVGFRILTALHMPQSHFLRQSFRKWGPSLSNESISRMYFPTNSPSSGVIVTGPQVSTCPPTCSCQEGVPPLKSHFHTHGNEGTWAAQGGLPVAARPGVTTSRLPGVTSGALLVKEQRHPG